MGRHGKPDDAREREREEDALARLVKLELYLKEEAKRLKLDIESIAAKGGGHGIAASGRTYRLEVIAWVLEFLKVDKVENNAYEDGRPTQTNFSDD